MGEIVSLAGDFYGLAYEGKFYKPYTPIQSITNKNITLSNLYKPVTKKEKIRFIKAFNSLYQKRSTLIEAQNLLGIIAKVENAAYLGKKYNPTCDYELATGGKVCFLGIPSPFGSLNGRYLKLAENNIDHFGIHAIRAYIIGHYLALQCAKEINTTTIGVSSQKYNLSRCFALEGYAQHFLTDIHSGGHIRTPRVRAFLV